MDKFTMFIQIFAEILFVCYLIVNALLINKLQKEIDALKSWIEVFWKIDFDRLAEVTEEEKK